MPTTYIHANGRKVGQFKDGVRLDYLTDALGSVTATKNTSQAIERTFRYKPYGAPLSSTGSGEVPKYRWTGNTGSRHSNLKYANQYNVYRHYGNLQAAWTTVDPLWPREWAYGYVLGNPVAFTDPAGAKPQDCRSRTVAYCKEALKHPSNAALRCFCRVSYLLCRFLIRADNEDIQTRSCYNCINKCLFDHFEDRNSSDAGSCWPSAVDPDKRKCLYEGDQCMWYIRCEQKTLTGCLDKKCRKYCPKGIPPPKGSPGGIWPFPFSGTEAERIKRGQELCCNNGAMGRVDAGGIVPIYFPIEKWGQ